ncbi:efflux transporter, RND family, MFP subunit [Geobacter metallireducens RCH3]|uniref:Efflux pump, RND family, membrane fusion protein n=1 Tax=Geobacter metallireducens (strain ATCC 53774 / DSM 7210 / GS-15) TaxID=269799 RepID=Q39R71_GEOMG|nr:efflux RND transporter periplasmic adaptor subunit [Geobacter metallireducens]ABB33253.1 efflux pump, RND family, membrane fusion protein [Geobacter metallireducens GS-15]EHP84688.1 efflux transporter, RND family, MFP subunit [Geobacter metallireducens RCH3]
MKKFLIPAAAVLVVAGVAAYFTLNKKPETVFKTAKIERGDIVSTVSATGNLAAVVTVQVGTQVSGTIQKLFVDYNSPVKKGQVIAQIDPSLFSAQVEQTRGNYLNAQANLQRVRADLADARRNQERNRQLLKDGVVSQSDFDAADNRYQMAQATVKAAEGSVAQTRGAFSQSETNLRYATIRSPVDGIVVSRNVDVGQTVAASFQTPTLFTIAQDLTRMEIDTSVDEADISRVQVGQPVSFTVDSYPENRFTGTVRQVRNAPVVTQNVVTYVVVIDVDNKDMKLKPGMTANVSIETARKDNVLKLPSAALRFRPKKGGDEKAAKGQQAGQEQRRKKREGGQQVYILGAENKPVPVPVKTGIGNDGQVELVSGNLKENDQVIIEQVTPQQKKAGGMGGSMGPRF